MLTIEEAVEAAKSNYPPEEYTILREALDKAIAKMESELENQNKEDE